MGHDSRLFRQSSTYSEDYPKWPIGAPHRRHMGGTVVAAPSQRESEYRGAYVGKPLPERTPSAAPAYVPPSIGPLSSRTEYRDHYEHPSSAVYQDVMPLTADADARYRRFDTTYRTDFDGPETHRKKIQGGQLPEVPGARELPDGRNFSTEYGQNYTVHPLGQPPDHFYPNPPTIPQVFVQEHLTAFPGGRR